MTIWCENVLQPSPVVNTDVCVFWFQYNSSMILIEWHGNSNSNESCQSNYRFHVVNRSLTWYGKSIRMHCAEYKNCTLIYSGFCVVCTVVSIGTHIQNKHIKFKLLAANDEKQQHQFIGCHFAFDVVNIWFFFSIFVCDFFFQIFFVNRFDSIRFDLFCVPVCDKWYLFVYSLPNFSAKAKWQAFNQFGRLFHFQFWHFSSTDNMKLVCLFLRQHLIWNSMEFTLFAHQFAQWNEGKWEDDVNYVKSFTFC